ncbi:hypothetical protein L6R53_12495 [Myxococcota bacterium]|nr:hypothetical protein [Myxococcota bacterium]
MPPIPTLALLGLACPRPSSPPAAAPSSATLLEVSRVVVGGSPGRCAFNEDRPWLVNVHASLGDGGDLEATLRRGVEAAGLGGQVVLDWFGDEAPERLELVLGRDLPVALARAVVQAARDHAPVPLVVTVAQEQSSTCSRSQAYVGSLLPTDQAPTTAEALDRLLATTDDAGFWALVPASGR